MASIGRALTSQKRLSNNVPPSNTTQRRSFDVKRVSNEGEFPLVEELVKHVYSVVAINCVDEISWGIKKDASLFFGVPLKMPDSAVRELDGGQGGKESRWHALTGNNVMTKKDTALQDLYTDFAWVLVSSAHASLWRGVSVALAARSVLALSDFASLTYTL